MQRRNLPEGIHIRVKTSFSELEAKSPFYEKKRNFCRRSLIVLKTELYARKTHLSNRNFS